MKDVRKAVYVIEQNGLYKVGISADPDARMKSLKLGLPKLTLVHTSGYIYNALAVEHYVHTELSNYAVGHEWFSGIPAKDIISIVDRAAMELGKFERENVEPYDTRCVTNCRIRKLLSLDGSEAEKDIGPWAVYINGECIPMEDRMNIFKAECQICTSLDLAGEIRAKHSNLLHNFRAMNYSAKFREKNYLSGTYYDARGRCQPLLIMNLRGLLALLMTCTAEKAVWMRERIMEQV